MRATWNLWGSGYPTRHLCWTRGSSGHLGRGGSSWHLSRGFHTPRIFPFAFLPSIFSLGVVVKVMCEGDGQLLAMVAELSHVAPSQFRQ